MSESKLFGMTSRVPSGHPTTEACLPVLLWIPHGSIPSPRSFAMFWLLIFLSNWVEYQGLHDIIDFLIWGRSYAFQHKEVTYAYSTNTDEVTLFLKTHHIDQITLLSTYLEHVTNVEYKKDNSINPFYMENWKCKTFSHLVQFYQEFDIKLPEIGHQNIFNNITFNIMKLSATKIKV